MAWVIDASAALALVLEDEVGSKIESGFRERMAAEPPLVPPLWWYEVSNALIVAQRRKRITPAELSRAVAMIDRFGVDVDHLLDRTVAADLRDLATTHQLSAYDAAYLELARRRRAALLTLDRALAAAAPKIGVQTI